MKERAESFAQLLEKEEDMTFTSSKTVKYA